MSEECDRRLNSDHTQILTDFPNDIENYRYDLATNAIVQIDQSILDQRKADEAYSLLRSNRSALLEASDWTQMPDSPLTNAKKQEWATYRQALRDLPANTTDPVNPTWPTQPT